MQSYIYFMSNSFKSVLYIGVTSDLEKRVYEHKNGVDRKCFTYKYNCTNLVYYEAFGDIRYAIEREKQLKNWKREWKNDLVNKANQKWEDLSVNLGFVRIPQGIAGQARNDVRP